MEQKIAFITGTSKGLGESITKLLLKKKYIVYGYYRTNTIKNPNFFFQKTNLFDFKELKKIKFPEIKKKDPPPKILLINNAAIIGEILPLGERSIQKIINEYTLNLIAPSIFCNQFIKQFPKQNKMILNISSGAAIKSIASWSTYCSSKSGLNMLTKSIKDEKHKNLKIFAISPGIMDTNMQKEIRKSKKESFPLYQKFIDYYNNHLLKSPNDISLNINKIIENPTKFRSTILTMKDF